VRKTSFSGTWLAGSGEDDLGIGELKASTTIIVPVRVFGSPLLVTPSFTSSLLDRPASMDIPSELYRASGSMMWMNRHSDRMNFMIGVTPGVASDFEATNNAFRIFGFGVAKYQWTPTTQWMLGAAYLDRDDIPILPMAGFVWTPNEDTRLELALPRPSLARRLYWNQAWAGPEDWVYLAGELGGGTYAVRHSTGFDDEMTLRDYRFILGIERRSKQGLSGRAEIGYVFGRKIEFERDATEFQPRDTILLRVGVAF
jgi:hypothetical protein